MRGLVAGAAALVMAAIAFAQTAVAAETAVVRGPGGRTWAASRRVTPTFDHAAAAQAGGFFLGDYQALDTAGTSFQPFFAANLLPQASGALGSDTFATRIR